MRYNIKGRGNLATNGRRFTHIYVSHFASEPNIVDLLYLSELRAATKAVRIELLTARVLHRLFYRVLEYSTALLLTIGWSKTSSSKGTHITLAL